MSSYDPIEFKFISINDYYDKYKDAIEFINNNPSWSSNSKLSTANIQEVCRQIARIHRLKIAINKKTTDRKQILTYLKKYSIDIIYLYDYLEKHKTQLTSTLSQLTRKRDKYKSTKDKTKEYKPKPNKQQSDFDLLFSPMFQTTFNIQSHNNNPYHQPQITGHKLNNTKAEDLVLDFDNYLVRRDGINKNKLVSQHDLNKIPRLNRSTNKWIDLQVLTNVKESLPDYSGNFIPNNGESLYKPNIGGKFYGAPGTWMFDIIYWSDSHGVRINYLLGININTRYAVGVRIDGKTTDDLILGFLLLINNELITEIKTIIFDGESAINSQQFKEFCKDLKINLHQTASGIHTQTAPIDRLCRTLRDYFKKWYIYNDPKWKELEQLPWFKPETEIKKIERLIQYRKYFAKEGKSKHMISPIPRLYNIDNNGNKKYDPNGKYDEFIDVIEYYNNKPHHGLQRLLEKAMYLFETPINCDIKEITPSMVHNTKGFEWLIVKYCHLYNQQPQLKLNYNIGQGVQLYNINNGALYTRDRSIEPYDYVIERIHGNVMLVRNISNGQHKWISKYMIV